MTQIIGAYGGYRKTFAFGYTCLVYHATCAFCRRNYDRTNDALGKTAGQMVGAARSARQNIVEGSARAGTGREAAFQGASGDTRRAVGKAGRPVLSQVRQAYAQDRRPQGTQCGQPILELRGISRLQRHAQLCGTHGRTRDMRRETSFSPLVSRRLSSTKRNTS